MPKIYRPGSTDQTSLGDHFLDKFTKFEIVVGGFLLATGGFMLRSTGRYDFVLIGGVLLVLGLVRLWRRSQPLGSSEEDDRVLMRLKTALDTNYTIVVDYEIGGAKIDYLVIGPPGVFVLGRLNERGFIVGEKNADEWQVYESKEAYENGLEARSISNPILDNKEGINKLRSETTDPVMRNRSDQPVNLVVLTFNRVDGPVLEYSEVVKKGDLTGRIKDRERSNRELDWEEINDLERDLSLRQ